MSPRDVVESLLIDLEDHNLERIMSRLSTRVVADIPPLGKRTGSRADTEAFFADLLRAFPDLRATVKRLVVIGSAVTVEVKVEGTQADQYAGAINQEKHLDIDEVWRFEVTDDEVTGFEALWCQQQLLRRLGVKRLDQVALV